MPHLEADRFSRESGVGVLGQEFAPEADADRLLRLVTPAISGARRQREADLGSLVRTRGLSGAQEADLFTRGTEADVRALTQSALQAETTASQAQRQERLLDESRRFDISRREEERGFATQNLINQLLGSVAGSAGKLIFGGGPQGELSDEDIAKIVEALALREAGANSSVTQGT